MHNGLSPLAAGVADAPGGRRRPEPVNEETLALVELVRDLATRSVLAALAHLVAPGGVACLCPPAWPGVLPAAWPQSPPAPAVPWGFPLPAWSPASWSGWWAPFWGVPPGLASGTTPAPAPPAAPAAAGPVAPAWTSAPSAPGRPAVPGGPAPFAPGPEGAAAGPLRRDSPDGRSGSITFR